MVYRVHAAWSIPDQKSNGDGYIDLVSASYIDNTVAWYQNLDGKGTFGFFFIFF